MNGKYKFYFLKSNISRIVKSYISLLFQTTKLVAKKGIALLITLFTIYIKALLITLYTVDMLNQIKTEDSLDLALFSVTTFMENIRNTDHRPSRQSHPKLPYLLRVRIETVELRGKCV